MSERAYYFVVGARSGSSRLPGKNALEIFGEPLYLRAVRQGAEAGEKLARVCRSVVVVFTTDCMEWAERVRERWPMVHTVMRPPLLCNVPSINFVRHALQAINDDGEPDDAVILLQPTSPFRTVAGIVEAVREWEKEEVPPPRPLVSGKFRQAPPYQMVGTMCGEEQWIGKSVLRADGALYVASMQDVWRKLDPFNDGPRRAWKAPPLWDIDIDTPEDWARAKEIEAMLKSEAGRVA